jgi:hypothetical protein
MEPGRPGSVVDRPERPFRASSSRLTDIAPRRSARRPARKPGTREPSRRNAASTRLRPASCPVRVMRGRARRRHSSGGSGLLRQPLFPPHAAASAPTSLTPPPTTSRLTLVRPSGPREEERRLRRATPRASFGGAEAPGGCLRPRTRVRDEEEERPRGERSHPPASDSGADSFVRDAAPSQLAQGFPTTYSATDLADQPYRPEQPHAPG